MARVRNGDRRAGLSAIVKITEFMNFGALTAVCVCVCVCVYTCKLPRVTLKQRIKCAAGFFKAEVGATDENCLPSATFSTPALALALNEQIKDESTAR